MGNFNSAENQKINKFHIAKIERTYRQTQTAQPFQYTKLQEKWISLIEEKLVVKNPANTIGLQKLKDLGEFILKEVRSQEQQVKVEEKEEIKNSGQREKNENNKDEIKTKKSTSSPILPGLRTKVNYFRRIPHIIHQMWLDKTSLAKDMPNKYGRYAETWKEKNPRFFYIRWTWDMVRYIQREFKDYLQRYQKFIDSVLDYHIEKCDFSRYEVLSLFGGFYFDLDFVCARPLTSLVEQKYAIFCDEPAEHCGPHTANSCMASAPLSPIWAYFMSHIQRNYNSVVRGIGATLQNTGPALLYQLTRPIKSTFGKDWWVPSYYLIPFVFPYLPPFKHVLSRVAKADKNWHIGKAYTYTLWNEGTWYWLPGLGTSIFKATENVILQPLTTDECSSMVPTPLNLSSLSNKEKKQRSGSRTKTLEEEKENKFSMLPFKHQHHLQQQQQQQQQLQQHRRRDVRVKAIESRLIKKSEVD